MAKCRDAAADAITMEAFHQREGGVADWLREIEEITTITGQTTGLIGVCRQ
jgi:hypothetical protein